jgi:hypothetical protein
MFKKTFSIHKNKKLFTTLNKIAVNESTTITNFQRTNKQVQNKVRSKTIQHKSKIKQINRSVLLTLASCSEQGPSPFHRVTLSDISKCPRGILTPPMLWCRE